MYKIYHSNGKVLVIAENDCPVRVKYSALERISPAMESTITMTEKIYAEALSTALLTKGITVADTKDLRILLSKMTGGGGMTDNTLYPIPESWQVKIEKGPSRKSGPFVTADIVTRAHLIPIEKPEPMSKDIIAAMTAAQFGTPSQISAIEEHMKEYFTRFGSYKDKFTHLEWYHIFLDFSDFLQSKSEAAVKEEDQDQLWDQVYNISKSMGRDNARVLYKELFTITRK